MASELKTWRVRELTATGVLEVGDGYRAKNDELGTSGFPFARAGNINAGFQFSGADRFPFENVAKVGRKLSQVGDVVFTSKGTVGRFAFVEPGTEQFVYSPQLCYWRSLVPSEIDPRFLYYWMQSGECLDQFSYLKGQTDMADYVSLRDQQAMNITLPSHEIQLAVTGVLAPIDNRIAELETTSATLESIARAIFKSWFVDFDPVRAKTEGREPEGMDVATAALFPEAINSSTGLPVGWVYKELRELASANRQTMSKGYPHAAIQYVDISSVEPGRIQSTKAYALADSPSRAKRLVQDGDVIWSCVRPNRRSFALVIDPEPNLVCSTGFVTLSAESVPFSYLYMSVTSNGFVDYLTQRADGAAYPAVRPDVFEKAELIVPSETIAARFNEIAEPMLRAVARNQMIAKTLAKLRDTLLPRLISGKLRVPEAEKLVEAAL